MVHKLTFRWDHHAPLAASIRVGIPSHCRYILYRPRDQRTHHGLARNNNLAYIHDPQSARNCTCLLWQYAPLACLFRSVPFRAKTQRLISRSIFCSDDTICLQGRDYCCCLEFPIVHDQGFSSSLQAGCLCQSGGYIAFSIPTAMMHRLLGR